MRVDELMTRQVITCRPTDTLDTAVRLMLERDCGVLPVIGNDGHLAGIVTDRDVCISAHNEGLPLHGIHVEHAMTTRVIAARPNDSVPAVERLMAEKQIRRVPVINDDGHLVGLISLGDIARAVGRVRAQGNRLVETVAAILRPKQRRALASRAVTTLK